MFSPSQNIQKFNAKSENKKFEVRLDLLTLQHCIQISISQHFSGTVPFLLNPFSKLVGELKISNWQIRKDTTVNNMNFCT